MFKVDSNIEEVKKDIRKNLQNAIKLDQALREASLDAVVLISDRVQQHGKKTDGTNITTPAKKKYNAYSRQYGKHREEEGYQTNYIDLTFSGDMMGDFVAVSEGENSYVIGFRGKTASDKADWNERRFGTIFQLSGSEEKLISDIIKKRINAILNK